MRWVLIYVGGRHQGLFVFVVGGVLRGFNCFGCLTVDL